MLGSHSVDPDLGALMHPNVHIVTRNSHKEAIEAFLRREGFAVKAVHSVKTEGRSKADVIAEVLKPGTVAIFADDDIREVQQHEHAFDIDFDLDFDHLSRISQLSAARPTHIPRHALLLDHADRVLIGACNPMLQYAD